MSLVKFDLYIIDEKVWKYDVIKFFDHMEDLLAYFSKLTETRDSCKVSVHNIRYEL